MTPTPLHSRLLRAALLAAALLAGAAHAQIILYKQPNYSGGELVLRGDAQTLANTGFYDQASSIVVRSGRWEVCTQPDFKGDCVILDRGEYPALDPRINHRIESVRQVGRYADGPNYNRGGSIALYSRPGFRGRTMRFDRSEDSLEGSGFDRDRGTASVIVSEGTWQLCSEPRYEGLCRVYEPGRYPEVARRDDQVASVRRVR